MPSMPAMPPPSRLRPRQQAAEHEPDPHRDADRRERPLARELADPLAGVLAVAPEVLHPVLHLAADVVHALLDLPRHPLRLLSRLRADALAAPAVLHRDLSPGTRPSEQGRPPCAAAIAPNTPEQAARAGERQGRA